MRRPPLRSSAFTSKAKRLLEIHPQRAEDIPFTLNLLAADCLHPSLRTHKLKGDLKNCWACSAGYDLRIVFQFVEYESGEAILLLTVGTHNEVY